MPVLLMLFTGVAKYFLFKGHSEVDSNDD